MSARNGIQHKHHCYECNTLLEQQTKQIIAFSRNSISWQFKNNFYFNYLCLNFFKSNGDISSFKYLEKGFHFLGGGGGGIKIPITSHFLTVFYFIFFRKEFTFQYVFLCWEYCLGLLEVTSDRICKVSFKIPVLPRCMFF